MIGPLILLLISLVGIVASVTVQGLDGVILIAGPGALGSFFLFVHAFYRGDPGLRSEPVNDIVADSSGARHWIVVDGSNAMHWKDNTPRLETLIEIVQHLSDLGYTPGVVFDANAGHILTGRYQHHAAMGRLLGLPEERILVVPKGEPADPRILTAARHLGARVLTNDRYRDWADTHPELREPGHLVRGGYRGGKLWVDLEDVRT